MKKLSHKICGWICLAAIAFGTLTIVPKREARADIWGADVGVLLQILVQAIEQVNELEQVIGNAEKTVSILEDMNRGVKEVLRLAETAHIPLPKQVYEQAKNIDQATQTARGIYGIMPGKAPSSTRVHYQSGVEGLYLSQDALEYSTFLDQTGENVKRNAVMANQATATRLTAETLGVVVQAVSHSNRIQAKSLEMTATDRLENSAKENAKFETFIQSHEAISKDLQSQSISPLNSLSESSQGESGKANGGSP